MPDPSSTGGIATLFHHLDLIVSSYHLDTRGPYSGDHVVLDDSDGILISNASGVAFQAVTFPPYWGRKLGFNGIALGEDWDDDNYNPPWGYVTFVATNILGRNFIYDRMVLSHGIEPVYFNETLPQALLVHCEPGWEFDVYSIRV